MMNRKDIEAMHMRKIARMRRELSQENYLMAGATLAEIELIREILNAKGSAEDKAVLRSSVKTFAEEMEFQLQRHDDRTGWDECDPYWLLTRLKEETVELEVAMKNPDGRVTNVAHEAADVANFAMMISDVVRMEFVERAEERFADEGIALKVVPSPR
jgi:NTP pyrophosphatase (non-canonical NTP hydrolase)